MPEKPVHHGRDHRPGGEDPIPGLGIYVDDRVITDPVTVVTFGVPSDMVVLELNWEITLENYPQWIGMVFAGDYPSTGNDYRWRVFGNVADDENVSGNSSAAIGGSGVGGMSTYGPHWGRLRFPNYNKPSDSNNLGIIWQGEGGSSDGNAPNTFLISGCGDPLTPLTEINVFATASGSGGAPDGSHIVAPSRLTLTGWH